MSLERRLAKLELASAKSKSTEEKRPSIDSPPRVREAAEHSNRCRAQPHSDGEPVFEITEDGQVFTLDGRPVTTYHQTGAEEFYQDTLRWHRAGADEDLILDEQNEAFYTPEGELAVSRTCFHLPALLGKGVLRGEGVGVNGTMRRNNAKRRPV